jgi:hypothetical protein
MSHPGLLGLSVPGLYRPLAHRYTKVMEIVCYLATLRSEEGIAVATSFLLKGLCHSAAGPWPGQETEEKDAHDIRR